VSALLQSRAEPDAIALAARTILVTDDSAANREIVRRLLERAGMVVTLANDGLEALMSC
jgi:CheY-like chemotaxis protein